MTKLSVLVLSELMKFLTGYVLNERNELCVTDIYVLFVLQVEHRYLTYMLIESAAILDCQLLNLEQVDDWH